jgi:hypothetical protein
MDYYDHFDTVANSGRVFDIDLSSFAVLPATLLPVETAERNAWRTSRENLRLHYRTFILRRTVMSREQFLEERVAPPLLVVGRLSPRYRSMGRNPKTLTSFMFGMAFTKQGANS